MNHRKRLLAVIGAGLAISFGPGNSQGAISNLPVAADTFVFAGAPDNNAGGHSWFDAGADGHGEVRRGLFRFDLSSIPAGSTITSATVRLTVIKVPVGGSGGGDSTFDLFRLQADWNEGNQSGNNGFTATAGEATWNARMFGTADWTAPGAASDAAATASASAFVGSAFNATYTWSSAALVSDVQFWLNNPSMNFGWLLRSQDEATLRTVRGFAALENGTSIGALQVGFTPAAATNSPPTVAITSPTNGASFASPATVTLDATASDSDGSVTNVEFFDGVTSLGSDTTSSYSVTVNLFPGTHSLTAVAKDNAGAATTSLSVTVTVTSVVINNPIPARIPKGDVTIELQTVADGMASPLGLAAPDDGSGRMFIYDQAGAIWVMTPNGRLATPMLDVRTRLNPSAKYDYDERGLLGLATHPNFALHPLLYTYTSESNSGPADFPATLTAGTLPNHQSVIAEWRIDPANTNRVDPASRREILRVDKPQSNHNGGTMRFGPDGFLYVTIGDGGQANDVGNGHIPGGNAQSTAMILGKLHRIDVDGTNSANGKYGIPIDNPFDGTNGLREIFAYGLRNPFSFSFDRVSGQLWLGDVGQNSVEEIDLIVKGGNYGWNIREGAFWFDSGSGSAVTAPVRPVPPDLIDPIAQYDHDDGLAIIGGSVYGGTTVVPLQGRTSSPIGVPSTRHPAASFTSTPVT